MPRIEDGVISAGRRWEVGGLGESGHIDIALRVDGQVKAVVRGGSSQVGREEKSRSGVVHFGNENIEAVARCLIGPGGGWEIGRVCFSGDIIIATAVDGNIRILIIAVLRK